MTLVLRKLDQKRNWDDQDWLPRHGIQAQVTKCLQPSSNKLSVFIVQAEQITRVVAALALTRDTLQHLDLAIVDAKLLSAPSLRQDTTEAQTPDREINRWHIDLIELSLARLMTIAQAIKTQGDIRRYQKNDVLSAIKSSFDGGFINKQQLKPQMRDSLNRNGLALNDSD